MGTVVVLGSLITDLIARAPRLPRPGESLIGDDFASFLGGKGMNQAIAASRQGADVTLIGRVGTDTFGDGFFPVLAHENIHSTYVERDPHIGTGVSLVTIAADGGQNTIVVAPQANMAVPAASVEAALASVQQKRKPQDEPAIFLCQCETSRASFTTGLIRARALGLLTILNAAPIPPEPLDLALFSLVDILLVNEVEASILADVAITSPESAQQAAEQLLAHGSKNVIITLGAQGSLWTTRSGSQIQHRLSPAYPVKAIDALAAGDAFCGTLAASLADKLPMEVAVQRAAAAGAITVTRRGSTAALPTSTEVEALLAQHPAQQ